MTTNKAIQFGDLALQFTSDFKAIWNDKGSGAKTDGAYWQPVPPDGFYILGSIGLSNYDDPNGKVAALCVKSAIPGVLVKPTGYELIWKDKGSGADKDGSCWLPIAPEGYVALGCVFMKGYNAPDEDAVRCVRSDLAYKSVVGDEIWTDKDSRADKDFGSWQNQAPPQFIDATKGLIAPNTFVAVANHEKPNSTPNLYCLMLTLPAEELPTSSAPTLTGTSSPPSQTPGVVDRIVWIPFTAIVDNDHNVAWKLENSPFYKIQRNAYYSLIMFNYNQTELPQTETHQVDTGVTTTKSNTFSAQTGISVTEETGVNVEVFSEKVSVNLSIMLGFEESTSVAQFQSESVIRNLTTPPEVAAALWSASYALQVLRADNSPVGSPMKFEVKSFVEAQYPHN